MVQKTTDNYIGDWHKANNEQIANFFDVDLSLGLNQQNIIVRLERFGRNIDISLPDKMQNIFKIWVKRDGHREYISTQYIMPGDVVFLETGCRVPADIRLLKVENLKIDESNLFGSTLPVSKNTFVIFKDTPPKDQKCIAFAGTFVKEGSGYGVVVAHSNKTYISNLKLKQKNVKNLKRGFKSTGILIQNDKAYKTLPVISMVFIDARQTDAEILEIIRKIQLNKSLSCKFIVDKTTALRLKKELFGAFIYFGDQLKIHVKKQFISMVTDAQFIADPSDFDLTRLINGLNTHDIKSFWITDGKNVRPAVKAASVSAVIGVRARDDIVYASDIIAINFRIINLLRILYNKNKHKNY